MKVILIKDDFKIENEHEHAVCLGMFDGVHIGHRELIKKALVLSEEKNLKSAAVTFIGNKLSNRIYTLDKQIEIFNNLGIDTLFVFMFDNKLKNTSPVNFIENYLIQYIKAKEIICGFNFTFGKNKEGNCDTLQSLSKTYGYNLSVIPPVKYNNYIVSSTIIKKFLSEGKIKEANKLLFDRYSIDGIVQMGKKFGRTINFPTVNVEISDHICKIKYGVYASKILFDNKIYNSITNIGTAPTVSANDKALSETYIFDFDGNLYNKYVRVFLYDFIREETKFFSIEELKNTIALNVKEVKEYFKGEPV